MFHLHVYVTFISTSLMNLNFLVANSCEEFVNALPKVVGFLRALRKKNRRRFLCLSVMVKGISVALGGANRYHMWMQNLYFVSNSYPPIFHGKWHDDLLSWSILVSIVLFLWKWLCWIYNQIHSHCIWSKKYSHLPPGKSETKMVKIDVFWEYHFSQANSRINWGVYSHTSGNPSSSSSIAAFPFCRNIRN